MVTSVVEALERDLTAWSRRNPAIGESALAAIALSMAVELDSRCSAAMKSMCAARLLETLEKLEAMTPKEVEKDAIDDLAEARAKRLAGRATS